MDLAVIRPAALSDLESLITFSQKAGIGITSLPQNPEVLETKLRSVEQAFSSTLISPKHEIYLFCLEWQNKVVGISGIVSRVGLSEPLFAYHLQHEKIHSSFLGVERNIPVLHFIEARKKPTELGTLFVLPQYRHRELGFGKLLSFSRYLFIANFRFRFANVVIAELRGLNENGYSPFWEAIGRHFFDIEFARADFLRTAHPNVIEELFPKHPIYLDLLPEAAKNSLGKLHPDTVPALSLLEQQGFKNSGYYDICDGGPHVFAHTDQILAIKNSKIALISSFDETVSVTGTQSIIANTRLNFRACRGSLSLTEDEEAIVHPDVASALQVGVGDPIRYFTVA